MRLLMLALLAPALLGLACLISDPGGVLPGITIAGEPATARTYRELTAFCRSRAERQAREPMTLVAGERKIAVAPRELGVTFSGEEAAARAWLYGREGSLLERAASRWAARRGIEIPLEVRYGRLALAAVVGQLRFPPRDALLRLEDGQPVVAPDSPGITVPLPQAQERLRRALLRGERFVFLPTRTIPAAVTAAGLRGIAHRRARVVVPVTSRHPGALVNVRLAARGVGTLLVPVGGTLSLNARLGKRTRSKGYCVAPVLIQGERSLGIGGGLCVVSTCVFQAAALAGLEIVERHAHARVARYSPMGLDATLSLPGLDLRIRNDTGAPVLFQVRLEDRQVVAEVWGAPNADEIRLATTAHAAGDALHVVTYRVRNGRREWLGESHYRVDT